MSSHHEINSEPLPFLFVSFSCVSVVYKMYKIKQLPKMKSVHSKALGRVRIIRGGGGEFCNKFQSMYLAANDLSRRGEEKYVLRMAQI